MHAPLQWPHLATRQVEARHDGDPVYLEGRFARLGIEFYGPCGA